MDKFDPLAVPEHVLREMAAAEETPTHRKISFMGADEAGVRPMAVRAPREVVERLEAQIEKHAVFTPRFDSAPAELALRCRLQFFTKDGEERILAQGFAYVGCEQVRVLQANMEQFKKNALASLLLEQEGFEAVPCEGGS